jgi:hypothetical protein
MVLIIALCLADGLGGCTHVVDCSGGVFRGGCIPGTETPRIETAGPAPASPTPAAPAAGVKPAAAPAGAGSTDVPRGDPATFADVDDKQCRSYGLVFGTRDYADCRIRLSAQHRGLDPDIGTTK